MRRRALLVSVPVLVWIALSGGCGDRPSTLYGDVTMDSKPLDEGLITFVAADGKTANVVGKIKDGKYSVTVPVGCSAMRGLLRAEPEAASRPPLLASEVGCSG